MPHPLVAWVTALSLKAKVIAVASVALVLGAGTVAIVAINHFDARSAPLPAAEDDCERLTWNPKPSSDDAPEAYPLGYAVDGSRILLRWVWNLEASVPSEFIVESRSGDNWEVVTTVTVPTDPSAAANIMDAADPRWPNLSQMLLKDLANHDATASELPEEERLMHALHTNPWAAMTLANRYYPVAMALGWGALVQGLPSDQDVEFRVRPVGALDPRDPSTLGPVTVRPGGVTPLPAPSALRCQSLAAGQGVTLDAFSASEDADANRRHHLHTYLLWDLPRVETNGPWVAGYDVFRRSAQESGWTHLTPDPVTPVPPTDPRADDVSQEFRERAGFIDDSGHDFAVQAIPFFFADQPPRAGSYTYVVAARDLLGNVAQPDAMPQRMSNAVTARARDFVPPAAPTAVVATADHAAGSVTVSWKAPRPDPSDPEGADVDHYVVERAFTAMAAPEASDACRFGEQPCWHAQGRATAGAMTWTDSDQYTEWVRWYRVAAVDAAGNQGPYSVAVSAVARDTIPPDLPRYGVPVGIEGPPPREFDETVLTGHDPQPGSRVSTDQTTARRYCTVEGSEPFLVDESNAAVEPLHVTDRVVFDSVTVGYCQDVAYDAVGNAGPASQRKGFAATPSSARPTPTITSIRADRTGPETSDVVLTWSLAGSRGVEQVRVIRAVDHQPEERLATLAPDQNQFADPGRPAGKLHEYWIQVVYSDGIAVRSEPAVTKALGTTDRRTIPVQIESATWRDDTLEHKVQITGRIDGCMTCDDEGEKFLFSVHRSTNGVDWVQITPVMGPVLGSRGFSYMDADAWLPTVQYRLMVYDLTTGEPLGESPAVAASNPWAANLPPEPSDAPLSPGLDFAPVDGVPCTSSLAPHDDGPLMFAGGFDVFAGTLGEASGAYSGLGTVTLTLPGQAAHEYTVDIQDVRVHEDNRVCAGRAVVHLFTGPQTMAFPGGATYTIETLELRPHQEATSRARLTMTLEPGLLAWTAGKYAKAVSLNGVGVTSTWQLTGQTSAQAHDCNPLGLAFRFTDLPLRLAADGAIRVTSGGIALDNACTRFLDPHQSALDWPRPEPGDISKADANVRMLDAQWNPTNALVSHTGMQAVLTSAPHGWITANPFAFTIRADQGLRIDIRDNRIDGGQVSGVGLTAWTRSAPGAAPEAITLPTQNLYVLPGGSLAGLTIYEPPSMSIGSAGSLRIPANPGGPYELFVGPVQSTDSLLAEHRGPAQVNAVIEEIPQTVHVDGRPAQLEPGLNLRSTSSTLGWDACSGTTATLGGTQADIVLRAGGVSGYIAARGAVGQSVNINGFPTQLQAFDLLLLDSHFIDGDIRLALHLAIPDLPVQIRDARLSPAMCVEGFQLGGGDAHLSYWDTNARFTSGAFGAPGTDTLILRGDVSIPHVTRAATTEAAVMPMDVTFSPNGDVVKSTSQPDQAVVGIDGLPFLLAGVDFGRHLTAPAIEPSSSLVSAPAEVTSGQIGWFRLRGAFVAPFLGLEKNAPDILVTAGDWVGASGHLTFARSWSDVPETSIDLGMPKALLVPGSAGTTSAIVGLADMEFGLQGTPVFAVSVGSRIDAGSLQMALGQASGAYVYCSVLGVRGSAADATAAGAKLDAGPSWAEHARVGAAVADRNGCSDSAQAVVQGLDFVDPPAEAALGGGQGGMERLGVKIERLRGFVVPEGSGANAHITEIQLKGDIVVSPTLAGFPGELLSARAVDMVITQNGEFRIDAANVDASMLRLGQTKVSLNLRIVPSTSTLEGGITVRDLDFQTIHIIEAGVALGVGDEVAYVGGKFDGKIRRGAQDGNRVGGAFLVGRIDPTSNVLKAQFPQLLQKISTLPPDPQKWDERLGPGKSIDGFYIRAYGSVPVFSAGCLLEINAGATAHAWYFANDQFNTIGGGIGGHVTGKAVCAVSVRGDISIKFFRNAPASGPEYAEMHGMAWAAGGIGDCDPSDWTSWDSRWWGDGGCWQGGGRYDIKWDTINGWRQSFDTDAEEPW